jgi:uncharacterized protein YozE (UPF0346 family)
MTFWQYVQQQKDRPDHIGDFARDAVCDSTYPRRVKDRERLRHYLEFQGACREALTAFERAYREWLRVTKQAVTVGKNRG